MSRKNFNRKLYDQNDAKGKDAAKELFLQQFALRDTKNDKELYKKGDLVLMDCDDYPMLIEAEVKHVGWEGQSFKYETLHFAYKPKCEAYYFVSFNKDCSMAFVCLGENLIKDENIVFKNTWNRSSGETTKNEPFYEIAVEDCEMFKKEDGKWKQA